MDTYITVIGAGVIGLSISYHFLQKGHKVILLEKANDFGKGVSSRNTEVIHAGIYYAKNSLKASLCIEGNKLIYDFCNKYNIRHKKLGKIFIASTNSELSNLDLINKQAKINGVKNLRILEQKELKIIEPQVLCKAGLLSPTTGIIDSHNYMSVLLQLSEELGLIFVKSSPFLGADKINGGWSVSIGGREPTKIKTKIIINSAGLYALELTKKNFPNLLLPNSNPVKGGYLRYSGKSPIKHIIYPSIVPGNIQERVDATPDISGSLRFGPSIEKTKDIEDFNPVENLVKRFTPFIKKYIPLIDENKLYFDQVGIRPKINEEKNKISDFVFNWTSSNGWLDLWGIESPGLTSSLAIGKYVYNITKEKGFLN